MNQDAPLGWDPAAKEKRDRERDIEIGRARIGDLYTDAVNRLTKRARSNREIIQWLYDLQKLLDEAEKPLGKLAPEVFAFDQTRQIIAKKIEFLTSVQKGKKNTAIQHIPATVAMRTDNKVIVAKRAKFKSIKQFNQIDFIKHFTKQPDFRGFASKMSMENMTIRYFIVAIYGTDSCIACELENDVCLDDFAQYDELMIGALREPAQARATDTLDAAAPSADTGESGTPSTRRPTDPTDSGSDDGGKPRPS